MNTQKFSFVAVLALCLLVTNVNAQVQTARYVSMIANSHAFYEYVPQGYPAAGVKYPVIIFFHGSGENGPGTPASLPTVLRNGPPKLIDNGTFPTSFSVNNTSFKVIVISPQFVVWPTEQDADDVITYVLAHYPVDINRVYLTGLSQGGGTVWNYSGQTDAHAMRLAGIFPVCGAGYPYGEYATRIAKNNLPVWATHNLNDGTVPSYYTVDYVNLINAATPTPSPLAKKTIFPVSGHDAWTTSYDPNFRENGLNMYEYMLQFKRSINVVLPVTGLTFTAAAAVNNKINLQWSTISEIDNPDFKILRSDDGINFTNIATVRSTAANGTGARYSYLDVNPLPGINYYRLEMQENAGNKTYSDTKRVQLNRGPGIVIYPNPAENVLHISNPQVMKNATLTLMNAGGQVLHREIVNSNGNLNINISRLPAGTYYGEIKDQVTGKQQFQFVKK